MSEQAPFDLVICGDVVLTDKVLEDGYIAIRGETIGAIGVGATPPARKVERYADSLLFPGLVDAQVHAGSHEGVVGIEDATRAAAAGGVTTIVDMPFDEPMPVNSVEVLKQKIDALGRIATVDVALYGTAPKGGDAKAIRDIVKAGAVSIKLSTYEYHPVRFPRFTTGEMYDIFREAADLGIAVAFHNEDQELVKHMVARAVTRGDLNAAAHGESRPLIAEMVANAQILELASHIGVRCHIVHSSIAGGNRQAAYYRGRGAQVSVESCIHYFIFNDQDMAQKGAFMKVNPPIRPESERRALWESLKKGEIDLISTDHVAWPESKKSDPDIHKNSSGMPGLETFLAAFYTASVAEHSLSPTIIARLAAENPAKHFGLYPKKGHLAPGADADIAVFRKQPRIFDRSHIVSKVKWSPFEGRKMAGFVTRTYLRARKVFDSGSVVVEPGFGRFVRPS